MCYLTRRHPKVAVVVEPRGLQGPQAVPKRRPGNREPLVPGADGALWQLPVFPRGLNTQTYLAPLWNKLGQGDRSDTCGLSYCLLETHYGLVVVRATQVVNVFLA